MTVHAAPYPWRELASLRRADVSAMRAAVRLFAGGDGVLREAGALFGVTPRVRLGRCGREQPAGGHRIALALAGVHGRVVIEIDGGLALSALDRAMGGTGGLSLPAAPVRPIELGMVSYLAGRLIRQLGPAWSIDAIAASRAELTLEGELAFVELECVVGADRGLLRVWLPALAVDDEPAARPSWLEAIEVELRVDIGRGRARAGELATLREGDALLVDEMWARCDERRHLQGEARAHARSSDGVLRCTLDGSGVTVHAIDAFSAGRVRGKVMTEDKTAADVVSDAEVEIAVEVARIAMPLRELAALRVGDVLTSKQATGANVTLRVGERTFAHGELVDVEGELGVRIVAIRQ